MGRFTDPGMCPATGSSGSTSPRKRAPARASTSKPAPPAIAAASSTSTTGIPPGRTVTDPGTGVGSRSVVGRRRIRGPCRVAAVEDLDLPDTGPAQQPPGPGRGEAGSAVVHHHGRVVVDARRPQRPLQVVRVGQRVPTAEARGCGEFGIQVDEDGAGQVAGQVAVPIAPGQRPADVEQHGPTVGGVGGQSVGEFADGDHGSDGRGGVSHADYCGQG